MFWLNDAKGICVPYAICDKEKQLERNELWESNVRPWFVDNPPDGYGWRGLGGEKDEQWCVYDHEYRDVTRQCSILYFDRGDEYIDPLSDRYVELWLI